VAALDFLQTRGATVNKPQTHSRNLDNLPPALLPLTEQERWVVWPWELRRSKSGAEKWTKPPRMARYPGQNARSNDPSTWGTYQDAVAAVKAGAADGIGYMLLGSGIGAIDLDHCVDRRDAKLDLWAEQLHDEADGAYQEITVSGGGLRIIGTVSGPETQRKFTFDKKTGAGIEIYRNTARYITVSGIELGSCVALPPLDEFIDSLVNRYGSGNTRRAGGLDFNDAGLQGLPNYDTIIRTGAPEGQRSEAFQSVVWHLAGQGWTMQAIIDELARHPNGIGAKYADRLPAEVERSYDKWCSHKRQTAGNTAAAANAQWPQIRVTPGELPRVVDEAESALLGLGREIYQRGGLVVRPTLSKLKASDDRETEAWRLVPVTKAHLVDALTCAARFLKYSIRKKEWVATDAPDKVAEIYLARQGYWKLPIITGVIGTPFLRGDGSICDSPGYDAATGLLFKPDCDFPRISQCPTKEDALAALKFIDDLIGSFPFVTAADRSVALSAILTPLDRHNMASAPLHAFTAPAAGTGKSMLVDMAAVIATGRPAPVLAQGGTEEELEKRLGAAVLAGSVITSIDNCEHPLQSAFLCQQLTQQALNVRILGLSQNVEVPTTATVFCTGNNLVIVGDLTRRTVSCSLDAGVERPDQRCFSIDPVATAKANRSELVAAGLTILKAWLGCGKNMKPLPFGSFEGWSRRVRSALLWLGQADPCDTAVKVRADDPNVLALSAVLSQWREVLGVGNQHKTQQVIERATNFSDFHAALVGVAGERNGNKISNKRLGWWCRRVEGRIIGGLKLQSAGIQHGSQTWSLMTI
jgi:hypothetical protein